MILMLCTIHIVKNHPVVLGNMLNLLSEELHCWVLHTKLYGTSRNLKNDGWHHVYIGKPWWILHYPTGTNLTVLTGAQEKSIEKVTNLQQSGSMISVWFCSAIGWVVHIASPVDRVRLFSLQWGACLIQLRTVTQTQWLSPHSEVPSTATTSYNLSTAMQRENPLILTLIVSFSHGCSLNWC